MPRPTTRPIASSSMAAIAPSDPLGRSRLSVVAAHPSRQAGKDAQLCSADMLGEEGQGALACEFGAPGVVAAALVAIEAVARWIEIDRNVGIGGLDLFDGSQRDVFVFLAEMQ